MDVEKAKQLGYEVIAASLFEVGLVKNGKGIRTWVCSDFGRVLPPLSHPKILEAIQLTEDSLGLPKFEDPDPAPVCQCDVCQIWGEGACQDDDPNFDPQEI